jgi:hypothetical protein
MSAVCSELVWKQAHCTALFPLPSRETKKKVCLTSSVSFLRWGEINIIFCFQFMAVVVPPSCAPSPWNGYRCCFYTLWGKQGTIKWHLLKQKIKWSIPCYAHRASMITGSAIEFDQLVDIFRISRTVRVSFKASVVFFYKDQSKWILLSAYSLRL